MDEPAWKYTHGKQIILDGTFGVHSSQMLLFIAMGIDEDGKGVSLALFLFPAPTGNRATHAGYESSWGNGRCTSAQKTEWWLSICWSLLPIPIPRRGAHCRMSGPIYGCCCVIFTYDNAGLIGTRDHCLPRMLIFGSTMLWKECKTLKFSMSSITVHYMDWYMEL